MGFSTIAILSPGNMGAAVGAQLGKSGYDVISCLTGAGQTKSPGRTVAQQSSADDQECIMIPQFNGQQTRKTDFVHQSCR